MNTYPVEALNCLSRHPVPDGYSIVPFTDLLGKDLTSIPGLKVLGTSGWCPYRLSFGSSSSLIFALPAKPSATPPPGYVLTTWQDYRANAKPNDRSYLLSRPNTSKWVPPYLPSTVEEHSNLFYAKRVGPFACLEVPEGYVICPRSEFESSAKVSDPTYRYWHILGSVWAVPQSIGAEYAGMRYVGRTIRKSDVPPPIPSGYVETTPTLYNDHASQGDDSFLWWLPGQEKWNKPNRPERTATRPLNGFRCLRRLTAPGLPRLAAREVPVGYEEATIEQLVKYGQPGNDAYLVLFPGCPVWVVPNSKFAGLKSDSKYYGIPYVVRRLTSTASPSPAPKNWADPIFSGMADAFLFPAQPIDKLAMPEGYEPCTFEDYAVNAKRGLKSYLCVTTCKPDQWRTPNNPEQVLQFGFDRSLMRVIRLKGRTAFSGEAVPAGYAPCSTEEYFANRKSDSDEYLKTHVSVDNWYRPSGGPELTPGQQELLKREPKFRACKKVPVLAYPPIPDGYTECTAEFFKANGKPDGDWLRCFPGVDRRWRQPIGTHPAGINTPGMLKENARFCYRAVPQLPPVPVGFQLVAVVDFIAFGKHNSPDWLVSYHSEPWRNYTVPPTPGDVTQSLRHGARFCRRSGIELGFPNLPEGYELVTRLDVEEAEVHVKRKGTPPEHLRYCNWKSARAGEHWRPYCKAGKDGWGPEYGELRIIRPKVNPGTSQVLAANPPASGPTIKYHNPFGLTDEQVGVSEGWRLLTADEVVGENVQVPNSQFWYEDTEKWSDTGTWGAYSKSPSGTLRVRKPLPPPSTPALLTAFPAPPVRPWTVPPKVGTVLLGALSDDPIIRDVNWVVTGVDEKTNEVWITSSFDRSSAKGSFSEILHGFSQLDGSPCGDVDEWWNPQKLTAEQVGVAQGYRLLTEVEAKSAGSGQVERTEFYSFGEWRKNEPAGFYPNDVRPASLRTKKPLPTY